MRTSKELGDAIRTARKNLGLRQDELAGAAGVGVRFIVDLEAAKPTIQVGKMLRVIDVLGLSLELMPRGGT